MKYLSICSGVEAATVAWHNMGWKPVGFSEIEAFPSAVLKHHYPHVPNFGDMTTLPERILSGEIEAPDLLVGGTPCQAFSIAGLRNSLDDDRGNISLVFIRIANAIDHIRTTRGQQPCIILWENVPGVYSTKDNAFGCFLAGLADELLPLEPSGKRWTNAGAIFGSRRSIAWRTLDAQFFGLPQQRRRCFVVSTARADTAAFKILFEQQSNRLPSAKRVEATASISALTATDYKGASKQRPNLVVPTLYGDRRLTPLEHERLQGFPDDYTNIPWRNKPDSPDSARYKAMGNSMAVPVMRWIGERIQSAILKADNDNNPISEQKIA